MDAVAIPRAHDRVLASGRTTRLLKVVAGAYLAAMFVYLFLPSLLVGLMSFNTDQIAAFPIAGLTLDWWSSMFGNDIIWGAVKNSLIVASFTTVIATGLGVLTAYSLVRFRFRLKPLLLGLLIAVMLIPYLVVGMALLSFWSLLGIERGLLVVVLAHVVLALPYSALVIAARLQGFDTRLEEAAEILGAGKLTTFRRVTLPLLMPGIVAAAALAFTISIDEFNVAYFLAGNENTLPIYIYSSLRFGVTPELNAISTLVLVVSMGLSALALRRV